MKAVVVLAAVLAVALGGRSPNADLVEELLKNNNLTSRFSSDIIADALLDAPGLIQRYQYPVEVHRVTTQDGYILEAHRIPYGKGRSPEAPREAGQRPVVFLMHGLLSSSADYLVLGPGNAIAYLLADEGYDVWLGNARGNHYSRNHVTLDPENNDFWRFSWEEIGLYDLPAFVDYILATTGQEKLHYIGHSQGGTVFLVLNSLRPEYNEKFISFQGFAPAAFFYNINHSIFEFLAPHEKLIDVGFFAIGIPELLPRHPLITALGMTACHDASPFHPLCAALVTSHVIGLGNVNATMMPLFLGHSPAGASIRQVVHYGQTIKNNVFARFDHGILDNIRLYGRITPPPIDVSKVTVPTYLYYGLADREVNYRDIHVLAERLANTVGTFRVERETFNHYEYIWGKDIKAEVFDRLFPLMRAAERN